LQPYFPRRQIHTSYHQTAPNLVLGPSFPLDFLKSRTAGCSVDVAPFPSSGRPFLCILFWEKVFAFTWILLDALFPEVFLLFPMWLSRRSHSLVFVDLVLLDFRSAPPSLATVVCGQTPPCLFMFLVWFRGWVRTGVFKSSFPFTGVSVVYVLDLQSGPFHTPFGLFGTRYAPGAFR